MTNRPRGPWRATALTLTLLLAAATLGAGGSGFLGRVAVEWDDNDLFNRNRVVLLADFGFQDGAGKQWIARKGVTLDGTSFSPLFEQLVGLPFVGEHRRAGILHDYFAQQLTHDWVQVRHMYYEALLAEGLSVNEAKTAYAVLTGSGMRWEVLGSSCYTHCHSRDVALRWKPDVTEAELEPVFELLNEGNPSLDEIDRAIEAAVPKPGPHLFAQLRSGNSGGAGSDKEAAPARAQPGGQKPSDDDDGEPEESAAVKGK